MTEREINIPRQELSRKSRKLVNRALNLGVDPVLVQNVISEARSLTLSRREEAQKLRHGGHEVINRGDLTGLREIVNGAIQLKRGEEVSL